MLLGAGLACVAIPVAIHLLMRRRRKPVRWAAMRFLLEAYKRRQQRLRLEQLLLLAARCLLIALIALAVGRPLLSRAGVLGAGTTDLYILLDNSLASALEDERGASALEASIADAQRLLASLDGARGDRAALILLGGEPATPVFPPTSDIAQVERTLREVEPNDGPVELAAAVGLVSSLQDSDEPRVAQTVAVLSGFREGSTGSAPVLPALGDGVRLLACEPDATARDNVGILAAEMLRPVVLTGGSAGGAIGASGQVRVRLMRTGAAVDAPAATQIRLMLEARSGATEAGTAVVQWDAGQVEAQATVDLRPGAGAEGGRAVIRVVIDRDANERDNTAWAVLDVRERLRVALIGTRRFGERARIGDFGPTDWLSLALRPLEATESAELEVDVLDAARVEAGQLAGFDAAVIAEPDRVRPAGWDAIGAFSARGGAVVLCAASSAGAQLWVESATAALSLPWELEREPAALDGLGIAEATPGAADLLWYLRGELGELAQSVTVNRILGVRGESGGRLLLTEDGRPLLLATTPGAGADQGPRGVVVLLATAIDMAWTDLPARPLMVPLFQELVRSGVGGGGLRRSVAGPRVSAPGSAVELREIAPQEQTGRVVAVDPSNGLTREPVRLAGVYEARDAGGRAVGLLAVQPDAASGHARPVDPARVQAWLSTALASKDRFSWTTGPARQTGDAAGASRSPTDAGPGLVLLAAALALACAELWLARLVSHAARPSPGAPTEGA